MRLGGAPPSGAVLCGFLIIVGFFLITEHTAHEAVKSLHNDAADKAFSVPGIVRIPLLCRAVKGRSRDCGCGAVTLRRNYHLLELT